MIGVLVVGVGMYLTYLLMAGRSVADQLGSAPATRHEDHLDPSGTGPVRWTALDDHQLNRLIDGLSP